MENAALSQTIVDQCPDAILFADAEGIIRLWNQGAERHFGFTASEAIGKSLDLIIPENLRQRHWSGYRQVMASGRTRYETELLAAPALRTDGSRLSTEFSMLLVRDECGMLLGCAAVIRDVSIRWNRERELRERIKALETMSS